MPDTTVKYFDSSMSGAPTLDQQVGTLIAVLDACLVNGFGSVTLDSLVVASNVATATYNSGHNFTMADGVGPVITIAGATPSGLNGEWRVAITGTTTFTFTTSGISDQTATGTITAKRAPAGFEKAHSGTNLAAYRSSNLAGTRLYCRIDDTIGGNARALGYESMSGISSDLVGPFPTTAQLSGGYYVYKDNATGSRSWTMFANDRTFYFFCDCAGNGTWLGGLAFGDINSYLSPDGYGCFIVGSNTSTGWFQLYLLGSSGGYLTRGYTQTGTSIAFVRHSHSKVTGLGNNGPSYPAPTDNKAHVWPVEVWDGTTGQRGLMAGLWCPVHAAPPHGEIISNISALPGRYIFMQKHATSYSAALDLMGPWT